MKSIELNWIRKKSDKSLPMPEVVFYNLQYAGGVYYPPSNHELYDEDGKPHSMRYGVILIDPKPEKNVESTIAHEWRHHWQHFNGIKFELSPIHLFKSLDYSKALFRYFNESKTELDALRFQYQHSFIHPNWEKTLFTLIEDLFVKKIISYGNNNVIIKKPKIHTHRSSI